MEKRQPPIESFFTRIPKIKKNDKVNESKSEDKENEIGVKGGKSDTKEGNGEQLINTKEEDKALETQLSDEVKDLLQLELTTMEPSWLKVLIKEIQKPYFLKLKQFLLDEKKNGKKVFPPEAQIYSWSRFTPLEQVKVVIIGQDPYHNDNQAHGLCFSVNKGIIIPPSLKNIYKEIKNEYPNFVIPKHGYLEAWANQGVLLLNAALTVQAHNANSHAGKGWEMFTDAIINYLNKNNRNLVFILWGSYAQKKGKVVDKNKHLILNGVHPSPLSASRGFFSCNHFQLANEYLKKHNRQEIDWCSIKD